MGNVSRRLLSKFRQWDRASQTAFVLAIVLLIPALFVASSGPSNVRGIATASVMGLVISAQLIFMWANRNMITDYTKAQRAYLSGEFTTARNILESVVKVENPRPQDLTLLGNIYRQLGHIAESESTHRAALERQPEHPFPLYGLGRTLLVSGRYSEAITVISQALEFNGPAVILVDLLEARYRDGDYDLARDILDDAEAAAMLDEPHRRLLVATIRHRLGEGDPPDPDLIQAGLIYWQAEADRFDHTPYGSAIQIDIEFLQQLI